MTATSTSTSTPPSALAGIAAAQLGVGIAAHVVAVRRHLPYELPVPGMQGRPENVARDSWSNGTALSAPITMLVTQSVAVATLLRRPSRRAVQVLAGLGTVMIVGYTGERLVRERLSPGGWEPVESSIAATGLSLATAMAVAAARELRRG